MIPSGLPEWAYRTTTGITEPPDAKKQAGHLVGEKPAAQHVNWLENIQSEWVKYLSYREIISDNFTRPMVTRLAFPSGLNKATGYNPPWRIQADGNFTQDQIGLSYDAAGGSHCVCLKTYIRLGLENGIPTNTDYYFSARWASKGRGPSGLSIWLGVPQASFSGYNGDVLLGASGGVYFCATGMSGPWGFNYGKTGITMAITPTLHANSGYQVFQIERQGSTLSARIDCPLSGRSTVYAPAGNEWQLITDEFDERVIQANPGVHAVQWQNNGGWKIYSYYFGVRG